MKTYKFKTDLNKLFPYLGEASMKRMVELLKKNHNEIGMWKGNVFHYSKMITQKTQGLLKGYAKACLHFQVDQE
tara:strand:- start:8577 stop:8798 length:222 start_codon:yes stop_codon:yes gene_type:complete